MIRLVADRLEIALPVAGLNGYEKFRPKIPPSKKGWGASGKLDLDLIRRLASA